MPRLRLAPLRAHARLRVAVAELGVVRRLATRPVKARLITLCTAFVFVATGVRGAEPSKLDSEHPVTKTLPIKAPQAVSAVFWSVQSDVCVLQVSFQPVPDKQRQPEHPRTQVWLLKADGTVIPQTCKPSANGISMANHTTDSISYVFPPAAKREACAVVISIGDGFFVVRLLPSTK